MLQPSTRRSTRATCRRTRRPTHRPTHRPTGSPTRRFRSISTRCSTPTRSARRSTSQGFFRLVARRSGDYGLFQSLLLFLIQADFAEQRDDLPKVLPSLVNFGEIVHVIAEDDSKLIQLGLDDRFSVQVLLKLHVGHWCLVLQRLRQVPTQPFESLEVIRHEGDI